MRVSELTGARLAYWVAKAEKLDTPNLINLTSKNEDDRECEYLEIDPENGGKNWALFEPHCNWAQGGPLLDKFSIDVVRELDGTFWASIDGPAGVPESDVGNGGQTRLIAAMRCIVRSVYGGNVPDVPA